MPFNGLGQFSRIMNWVTDAANGIFVDATRTDEDSDDIADGLSNCITKDGQQILIADIPWSGFKITGLGAGAAPGDAVNYGQVFNSPTFSGLTATGAVNFAGATSVLVPTATAGDNTTKAASTAFVIATAFNTALPTSAADAGKYAYSNGTTVTFQFVGVATLGATVTDNYTILTKTPTQWPIATTAIGKCLTAPTIATTDALGLFAILDNSAGTYPVGWRDSTGALVGKACVAAGGIAHVYLESNATAAGTWRIVGNALEPGLITVDSTLSSTYLSTFLAPFVALDANTSIHFVALSSGFAALIVDNTGKVVMTPVTVDATASSVPNAIFKISATQAICFYSSSATANGAVVLTVSGASPSLALAVGTAATYTTTLGTGWGGEDSVGAPKIAQLSTTLYLLGYASTTSLTAAIAISVSGATVTIGVAASIITSNAVVGATTTYPLTATTGLVIYKSGASAPYTNYGVVVSVSGTTCTPATPVAPAFTTSASAVVGSSCLLSPTLALIMDDQNGNNGNIYTLTIAGTVITAGTLLTFEGGAGVSSLLVYNANSATRHNPHLFPLSATAALLWYFDTSSISRCVALSASAGVITKGSTVYRSFSQAASGSTNFGMMLAQGTAEFITVVQNGAAAAWKDSFVPHKINGTAITYGNGAHAPEFSPVSLASALPSVKLTSGDYVTMGANASGLSVLRTNGDAINKRGVITLPNLSTPAAFPIPAVASNRVVLMSTSQGTTVSGSTQQMRVINVEIAQ